MPLKALINGATLKLNTNMWCKFPLSRAKFDSSTPRYILDGITGYNYRSEEQPEGCCALQNTRSCCTKAFNRCTGVTVGGRKGRPSKFVRIAGYCTVRRARQRPRWRHPQCQPRYAVQQVLWLGNIGLLLLQLLLLEIELHKFL